MCVICISILYIKCCMCECVFSEVCTQLKLVHDVMYSVVSHGLFVVRKILHEENVI